MSKWDHLDHGLILIVFGIFTNVFGFYFTGKLKDLFDGTIFIILGLSFIVFSILNIPPFPKYRKKLRERDLLSDQATIEARKKQQKKISQIMIVLGVVGLAILGYQWFTDSDYKSYSGFGISFEYPKGGEVIDEYRIDNNQASSEGNGELDVSSQDGSFSVLWLPISESIANSSYSRKGVLNILLNSVIALIEPDTIEYMDYDVSGHVLTSGRFRMETEGVPSFGKVGFLVCDESQRTFVMFYYSEEYIVDDPNFQHYLESFQCH